MFSSVVVSFILCVRMMIVYTPLSVCEGESGPGRAAEGDVRAVLRGLRARSADPGRRHRWSRHHASQHLPPLCSRQGEISRPVDISRMSAAATP